MLINGWRYYNHAAIPTTAPHEEPDLSPIESKQIWKLGDGKAPLLARWTTDFDCGYETNWWYVIKDTPLDTTALKAKRRYEINKGVKNFEVVTIDPVNYAEDLYKVQVAALAAYPGKHRPVVDRAGFIREMEKWRSNVVLGAFHRETNELCGYAFLTMQNPGNINFSVLKAKPEFEKLAVNAALVEGVLRHFEGFLSNGGYICDGARSINHETAFQDYLEKYFGFRKAYCRLCITYNPKIKWLIKLLFPMRRLLLKLDGIGIIHSINAILRMEEIHHEGMLAS